MVRSGVGTGGYVGDASGSRVGGAGLVLTAIGVGKDDDRGDSDGTVESCGDATSGGSAAYGSEVHPGEPGTVARATSEAAARAPDVGAGDPCGIETRMPVATMTRLTAARATAMTA
jgi:hypothetical protein